MASHRRAACRGRRFGFIEVIFIGAVAGAISCEGAGSGEPPRPAPDQTAAVGLTTGRTAADEQARAAAYASKAATYRQLSADNKRAVAELAVATAATAPVRTKRQAAADLADRMAAAAQRAADFHTQRAADIAAVAAGGTVSP